MSYTILDQIVFYKKNWILNKQKKISINTLKSNIQISERNFYKSIYNNKNRPFFIFEYKPASPSKGIIHHHPNPINIAHIYKNYATIISVVTDEKYFHGHFNILTQIRNVVTQPILCKDFFISEWQVYFARFHKADAILLMLSIIDNNMYRRLTHIAHSLNMGVLTEITNEQELNRAILLNAKVIGINNRNLHDLSIDLHRTIHLSKNIPNSIIKISESGINKYHTIKQLQQYVNGFLIGTILMSSQQLLYMTINKLILGENKICGLTRIEDANISYKSGAIYGGLIFVKNSPRYINMLTATNITSTVHNLYYVGVFCNEKIYNIINIVKTLNLSVVQLHGSEDQSYINQLRTYLPNTCKIWKSINMNIKPSSMINLLNVDRYLLDNKIGGSGKTFNWNNIINININKSILSGGLTINNCLKASKLGCSGLDFNSGIEIQPGIKDHQAIKKIFQILRNH